MSATLGRLWAVASLTLKEAVRRKAFLVLLLFAVALLSSTTFFSSVDPVSKLRLIEVWSLRATIFFAAIAAIFLGSASLPGDYEAKRIYVLASKPISKITFLLGKYLGFLLMLAIFLLVMGAISVAYIRIVKATGGPDVPELRARPRVAPTGFEGIGIYEPIGTGVRVSGADSGRFVAVFAWTDLEKLQGDSYIRGRAVVRSQVGSHRAGFARVTLRPRDTKVLTHVNNLLDQPVLVEDGKIFEVKFDPAILEPGRFAVIRVSPADSDLILGLRELEIRNGDRVIAALNVQSEGAVRDGDAYGCAAGAIRWTFADLDPADYPETVTARLFLQIGSRTSYMRFTGDLRAIVESGEHRLEARVFAQSNEWATVTFPRAFLAPDRPVAITLLPVDPDIRMVSRREGAVFFEKSEPFEWNFLKGVALMYLWIALILTISFFASVVLSAPVSMLFGVALLLAGSMHGFTGEGVKDIDRTLAQIEQDHDHGHARRTSPGELPEWLLRLTNPVAKAVLFAVPNADTYDFQRFLTADFAVSADDLLKGLIHFLPRALLILLVGVVMMLLRDFGQ